MSRVLRPALSVALLATVVWYAGGIGAVLGPIRDADLFWVAASFIVATLDRLLMTFKWIGLLRSRGVLLGVLPGFRIYCSAMIIGLFLPATMGADAARVVLTVRRGIDGHTVVASVVVERMLGFIASLLFGLAGFAVVEAYGLLHPSLEALGRAGAVALAAAVVLFALSLSHLPFDSAFARLPAAVSRSRVAQRLERFHRTYAEFRRRPGALAAFFTLTLLEQLVTIFYVWCTARAVGVDVGLLFMAGVLPLTLLVSRLPISFDGLGVFEAVFVALMGLGGVSPPQAVSIAVIGRIIQTLAWLPWSLAQSLERPGPARLPIGASADPGPASRALPETIEPRPYR